MQLLPPGAEPTSVGFINLPNPDKTKVALKMESHEKIDVSETADQQGLMSLTEPVGHAGAKPPIRFAGDTTAALQDELERLQKKLDQWQDAVPMRLLDAEKIRPSRWDSRLGTVFQTAQYAALKVSIATASGNVSPVLVRPHGDVYEVITGSLRVRICRELGLPVKSVVQTLGVSDQEVFQMSELENHNTIPLSPLEQGLRYKQALADGLFSSQRRLAEYLGLSHTWVNQAIQIAKLPEAVKAVFPDPRVIQPKIGSQLSAALDADRDGVLGRAALMAKTTAHAALSTTELVNLLLGVEADPSKDRRPLDEERPKLGDWQHDGGKWLTVRVRTTAPDRLVSEIRRVVRVVADADPGSGNKVSTQLNFEMNAEAKPHRPGRRPRI